MTGTPGADVLNGTDGVDVIFGGGGDDVINGFGGNDLLCGAAGNDHISGGTGNDKSDGGTGEDTAMFVGSANGVTASLTSQSATGQGTDVLRAFEDLTGSAQADRLTGDGSDNILEGAGGNDTLNGGDGDDFLIGEPGNDTMSGGNGWFDIALFATSSVGVTASLRSGTASGEGADTLSGVEGLVGSRYSDTLVGDGRANFLFGLEGNDVLDGRGGTDFAGFLRASGPIVANLASGSATGEGTDKLIGLEGLLGGLTPTGTDTNDTFVGDAGPNVFFGFGGNDALSGGAGDDVFIGGVGNDSSDGGDGNDTIFEDEGNDRDTGGVGAYDVVDYEAATKGVVVDLVNGNASGAGTDTIAGVEAVRGSPFNDWLVGDAHQNLLRGLAGDDAIIGGGGNDRLYGDDGTDSLNGGDGKDLCTGGESRSGCEFPSSSGASAGAAGATSAARTNTTRLARVAATPPSAGPSTPVDAPGRAAAGTDAVAVQSTVDNLQVPAIVECSPVGAGVIVHPPFPPPDGLTNDSGEEVVYWPQLFQYDFNAAAWVPVDNGRNGFGYAWYEIPNRDPLGYTLSIADSFGGGEWHRFDNYPGDPNNSNVESWDVATGVYYRVAGYTVWYDAAGNSEGSTYFWEDWIYNAQPDGPWCIF